MLRGERQAAIPENARNYGVKGERNSLTRISDTK